MTSDAPATPRPTSHVPTAPEPTDHPTPTPGSTNHAPTTTAPTNPTQTTPPPSPAATPPRPSLRQALRPWRALLTDSLRETFDQRSLHVLLLLGAILALAIAGTSFEPAPLADLLRAELPAVSVQLPGAPTRVYHAFTVLDIEQRDTRHRVRLQIDSLRFARELLGALRGRAAVLRGEPGPDPLTGPPTVGAGPLQLDEVRELLRRICDQRGYGYRRVSADGPHYLLELSPERLGEIVGGGSVQLLFGAVRFEPTVLGSRRSYTELLMVGQGMVVDWLAGALGMAIAVVFTAGFLPRRLRRGAVEPLLARPLRRSTVFWATYFGGLFYVAVLSGALVGGSFLVVGLRTGFWNWPYLLTIPSVTAMFAVLHAISVFWATATRSATTAILMTLLTWAGCFAVNLVRSVGMLLAVSGLDSHPELRLPGWLLSAVELAYWALPSPTDFDYFNAWCVAQGPISAGLRDRFLATSGYHLASGHGSLLASLLFAAVALLIARTIFCRRDL